MKLRFLGSLSALAALLALTLASYGDDQRSCHSAARECEQQIRQMLAGPRYLGVDVVQLNTGSGGGPVVIKNVLPKSPAERAALLPGDWLIAANGRPTRRIADFKQVVADARQTGKLWLIIRRRNALKKVEVRLEPFPKEYVEKVIAAHVAQSHPATASGAP
jgi:predicted metalloprotease with PDZ domain